jgi:hypothetical protein
MNLDLILRVGGLCLILACAETLHGIARTVLVVPRIGKELATKLSIVTGTALAAAICWILVPDIRLQSAIAHLALGAWLAVFMASFDIAMARLVLRKSWGKIWPDFDPRTGNYLLFGVVALVFVPLLVWITRTA